MTHNFSDDELNYLDPAKGKEQPGTEAVAFDPFADDDEEEVNTPAAAEAAAADAEEERDDVEIEALLKQVGASEGAAATEAVAYDPFADDELEDEDEGTSAVAFDPFADDDDDTDGHSEESFTDSDNIAALIKDLGVLRDRRENDVGMPRR